MGNVPMIDTYTKGATLGNVPMIDIKDLSKVELEDALEEMGAERYRARQIWRWLYKSGVRSFDEMTDIPKPLCKELKRAFHISNLALLDSKRSLLDGTTKYLVKLEDGNQIEAVYLPEAGRATACLSSQVGCKFRCAFCASAEFGFIRNLTVSEILDEVIFIKSKNPSSPLTNLVFMGIGEPLDNYDNVIRAIRILNDRDAFGIGARKITISTCGIIPGIKRLAGEGLQVELSVSLHSADDGLRSKLIPINKTYPLKELMAASKEYIKLTNRIITFECVLVKNVNSSREDALKLAALLKGVKCKVNTIAYNQANPAFVYKGGVKAEGYEPPANDEIRLFIATLKKHSIHVMHRKSKGGEIDAGCGQLKAYRGRKSNHG